MCYHANSTRIDKWDKSKETVSPEQSHRHIRKAALQIRGKDMPRSEWCQHANSPYGKSKIRSEKG